MSTDHGPVYRFAVVSNQLKPEIPMSTALREASDDEGDATGAAPKVEPDETQIDRIEHPNHMVEGRGSFRIAFLTRDGG